MKDLDIYYLCRTIGNLAGVPIRVYTKKQLDFSYSLIPLIVDPVKLCLNDIQKITSHVGYFVTGQFYYYGIINSQDTQIVIGPTRQTPDTPQALRELAFQLDIPTEDVHAFIDSMNHIVRLPFESIMQILCTLNYILNDERLELADITIYDSEQKHLKEVLERQYSDLILSQPQIDAEDYDYNTYALEQELLHLVRRGDTAALRAWIASAPAIRGGMLALDQLRHVKNTFLVSVTLVSRAAIQGGLNTKDAFSLSDLYIQKCELLNSLYQITNLQYHMVLDFTERVERLHLGGKPTQLTIAVANYVQSHLSQPIRIEEMAKEFYISRPYLSSKFKEETGESLTDFILKEKTEEAKRLLRYSDKNATTIASYLGFSSLGHFSQVFKRYNGHTPSEYREKYAGK